MKQVDRDALREWDKYKEDIKNSTPVDVNMTPGEIEKHRIYLEAHPVEWIQFFFPKYAKYPFAPFHIKAIHRIINNPEWYEVLSWSRELAKSTVCMFIVLYLVLTGKKRNVVLTSNSKDNAVRLLAPYRANLETNGRIKAYYGEQMSVGFWAEEEFITKGGAAFRALGAGQSPRGSRNEEIRPDVLIPDDFDTDEDCQNPDTIEKKWDWFEKALYPARSISEPTLVLWCGNIIAKDCCITRAGKMANHWDVVNIRDEKGKSTWPEKNTEELIDQALSHISAKAIQGEYYNNPVSAGAVFKRLEFRKIPNLKKFPFLVIYGDPTQSELKGRAANKKGSRKAVWLCGMIKDTLYIIKGFIFKGTNADFINYYFVLYKYVGGVVPVYIYQENNSLQDPFFQQVFKPLMAKARKRKKINITVTPDTEKKPDKAVRIEADLEPMDREGRLVFNKELENDPDMKELKNEFEFFTLALNYPADGADCIQGAKRIIEHKIEELIPAYTMSTQDTRVFNKHRM